MSNEQGNITNLSTEDRARVVRVLMDAWELAMAGALGPDGNTPQDGGSQPDGLEYGKAAQQRIFTNFGFILDVLRATGEAELKRTVEASNASREDVAKSIDMADRAGGFIPLIKNQFDLLNTSFSSECIGGFVVLAGGLLSAATGVGAVAGGFALVVGTAMIADGC